MFNISHDDLESMSLARRRAVALFYLGDDSLTDDATQAPSVVISYADRPDVGIETVKTDIKPSVLTEPSKAIDVPTRLPIPGIAEIARSWAAAGEVAKAPASAPVIPAPPVAVVIPSPPAVVAAPTLPVPPVAVLDIVAQAMPLDTSDTQPAPAAIWPAYTAPVSEALELDPASVFSKAAANAPEASVKLPPGDPGALAAAWGLQVPAQPATPAATPPIAGTAPNAAPVFDVSGLPWDIRIHAGTKGTNKDGKWKKKNNVDLEEVLRVEAEIRGLLASTPPAAPAEGFDAAAQTMTFPALMAWASARIADGGLVQNAIFEVIKPFGLTSPVALANKPELIPHIYAALEAMIVKAAA